MAIDFRENERQPGGARYRFQHRPNVAGADTRHAVRQGEVLRGLRVACGLSLRQCADSMGLSHVEWGELERGRRCFLTRQDLWAALSQLWLMRDSRPEEGDP